MCKQRSAGDKLEKGNWEEFRETGRTRRAGRSDTEVLGRIVQSCFKMSVCCPSSKPLFPLIHRLMSCASHTDAAVSPYDSRPLRTHNEPVRSPGAGAFPSCRFAWFTAWQTGFSARSIFRVVLVLVANTLPPFRACLSPSRSTGKPLLERLQIFPGC
jgi:hypothetical protein